MCHLLLFLTWGSCPLGYSCYSLLRWLAYLPEVRVSPNWVKRSVPPRVLISWVFPTRKSHNARKLERFTLADVLISRSSSRLDDFREEPCGPLGRKEHFKVLTVHILRIIRPPPPQCHAYCILRSSASIWFIQGFRVFMVLANPLRRFHHEYASTIFLSGVVQTLPASESDELKLLICLTGIFQTCLTFSSATSCTFQFSSGTHFPFQNRMILLRWSPTAPPTQPKSRSYHVWNIRKTAMRNNIKGAFPYVYSPATQIHLSHI